MKKVSEINNTFDKKIIAIVLGIFLVILLIAGSYATWYWGNLGESNLINAESVELEFLESDSEIINLEGAFPVIDSVGIVQEDTFDFQVRTKTKKEVDISYALYIEKLEADSGYTVLQDKEVKVYLTDFSNNEKVAPTKISELDNYSLYNEINSHNESNIEQVDKYKLRVWIDEDVTAEDWDENTKIQYKFKIGVKTVKPKKLASKFLMSKVGESGLGVVTHEADSTLQIGASESLTEYRFRGGNDVVTNNYVYFNCDDINNQSSDTCELYRIIGVFPVDDGTGNIENRLKLIKAENYGNNLWNKTSGTNNWAEPATLNTTFNTTYWNTINEKYQALIGNAKYYLGGYVTAEINTIVIYQYERKTEGTDYYYTGNPMNWIGKMALMYASDYGYGANSACSESTTLYNYEMNSCRDNNWLYLGSTEWLLMHYSLNSHVAFHVESLGFVYDSNVSVASAVRPVFYLTSDVEFNDIGDGSVDNPYQLK